MVADSQQHRAGDAVAQDPENLVADIRLQAVESQDDPALPGQEPPQAMAVGQGGREELVIAVEQIGDAALCDHHASLAQGGVDLRDGAVVAMTQGSNERHDVKAERVLGQRQSALSLGPIRPVVARTRDALAAADLQVQAHSARERHQGAAVLVADPHRAAAGRAEATHGAQDPLPIRHSDLGSGHRHLLLDATPHQRPTRQQPLPS